VGFIRTNYLALFPKLVDQSQFNRRARALRLMIEQFRRYWIIKKGWHLDTTTIHQHYQNARDLDRWLSSIRERIDGVFHEMQNFRRNIERLLTKTVLGL
jgi:hypothetical protein